MSEIKDSFGNPLQINAVYNYIYHPPIGNKKTNHHINLTYVGYCPDARMLEFKSGKGLPQFISIDNKYKNNYILELVTKAALEPPSATPTQPPIVEEKGSEEKGGKRRKSKKTKKSKKSRKSRKLRR